MALGDLRNESKVERLFLQCALLADEEFEEPLRNIQKAQMIFLRDFWSFGPDVFQER